MIKPGARERRAAGDEGHSLMDDANTLGVICGYVGANVQKLLRL